MPETYKYSPAQIKEATQNSLLTATLVPLLIRKLESDIEYSQWLEKHWPKLENAKTPEEKALREADLVAKPIIVESKIVENINYLTFRLTRSVSFHYDHVKKRDIEEISDVGFKYSLYELQTIGKGDINTAIKMIKDFLDDLRKNQPETLQDLIDHKQRPFIS